jgi:tRNA A-37 threonylcarbamoyl transferase component Bud32
MEEDATRVLLALATYEQSPGDPRRGRYSLEGHELERITKLDPDRINDAVELLEDAGQVDVRKYLGTSPFDFGGVELTARGRREAERVLKRSTESKLRHATSNRATNLAPQLVVADPRYVATARQGEGAFGEVWRGEDTQLHRPVAIKFVRDALTNQDALAHARAVARVEHPNIVVVYVVTHVLDPSTGTPTTAIVMQFVDGATLEERLRHVLSADDVRRIGMALLGAVAAYHRNNLAHLDLHGGNVIVSDTDVKVIDPSCSGTEFFRSTATRANQQARDIRDVRDLLRRILQQSSLPPQPAMQFISDTVHSDLASLQCSFEELFSVVTPVIHGQVTVVHAAQQMYERAMRAAPDPEVRLMNGVFEIVGGNGRRNPVTGPIHRGLHDDVGFELRIPVQGVGGIPCLLVPWNLLREVWPENGHMVILLHMSVRWNGREMQLVNE